MITSPSEPLSALNLSADAEGSVHCSGYGSSLAENKPIGGEKMLVFDARCVSTPPRHRQILHASKRLVRVTTTTALVNTMKQADRSAAFSTSITRAPRHHDRPDLRQFAFVNIAGGSKRDDNDPNTSGAYACKVSKFGPPFVSSFFHESQEVGRPRIGCMDASSAAR